jgi:hypothetical protein
MDEFCRVPPPVAGLAAADFLLVLLVDEICCRGDPVGRLANRRRQVVVD